MSVSTRMRHGSEELPTAVSGQDSAGPNTGAVSRIRKR